MIKISKRITSLLLSSITVLALISTSAFAISKGDAAQDDNYVGGLVEGGSDSIMPDKSEIQVHADGWERYVSGWNKVDKELWVFANADKTLVRNSWLQVNGIWYHFYANGIMQTGWFNDNGTWYYLNDDGSMKTGWLKDGANWYYLTGSGAMATNTTINGYYVDGSGAWVQ